MHLRIGRLSSAERGPRSGGVGWIASGYVVSVFGTRELSRSSSAVPMMRGAGVERDFKADVVADNDRTWRRVQVDSISSG